MFKQIRKFFEMLKWRMSMKSKSTEDTATLGVMPDYVYNKKGMRISSVSKGKTAEKFGFYEGDVVTKIGDHDINDLMGYMSVLSKLFKGDQAKVNLIREEKEMQIVVTFQ